MDFLLLFVVLFFVGLIAGSAAEKNHLRSLEQREKEFADMLVTNLRSLPGHVPGITPHLLVSEVSIASDYFKTFVAKWKNFFGGTLRSFELLQMRARREATLRLMQQAQAAGFNAIGNLRLDTADIGGNASTTESRNRIPMVSVIASGTAYRK